MKYLVVEEGWEYNDEYYNSSEGGAYTITSKLYNTREEAQKVVDEEHAKLRKEAEEEGEDYTFVDYENDPIYPFKVVAVKEEDEV